MAGSSTGWARRAAFVLALSATTRVAHAHAPLPRYVALTPDGTTTALDLPGFGMLFRSRPEAPFAYLCDALLGVRSTDLPPAMAFLADGSLLLGSMDGMRIVTAAGCPLAKDVSELGMASVFALSVQPVQTGSAPTQTAYAVVGGDRAGLWRSSDGGRHWEPRASLGVAEWTNAVVVRPDNPEQVYLSVANPLLSSVFASSDGGATLTQFPQELALRLLHAEGGGSGRLWATARDAQTVGNRGLPILRADGPGGPWHTTLRVNYFGGFVVDPHGVIWVGDEIGGLYRSDDGGDTFVNLEAATDVACLAYAGEGLWACTPGTASEPALQTLVGAESPFVEVVAFDEVEQLVTCPELDVDRACAPAWAEWQRDVLMRPAPSQDAGTPSAADASPAQPDGADAAPAPDEPSSAPSGNSGCSVRAASHVADEAGHTQLAPRLWFALCALLALRRGRRARLRLS
jgi:hypothetical protein